MANAIRVVLLIVTVACVLAALPRLGGPDLTFGLAFDSRIAIALALLGAFLAIYLGARESLFMTVLIMCGTIVGGWVFVNVVAPDALDSRLGLFWSRILEAGVLAFSGAAALWFMATAFPKASRGPGKH